MEPSRQTWSSYGPPYPLGRMMMVIIMITMIVMIVTNVVILLT